MPARDERAVCEVERAGSRGRQGRPAARGAQQTVRWSRRNGQLARCSGSQLMQRNSEFVVEKINARFDFQRRMAYVSAALEQGSRD